MWAGPAETTFRVSAFGELRGLDLPEPEDPWQFIPYIIGSYEDGVGEDFEAGIDIRWRPSSQVGVDLTVNPDFALIEADVETINLSRFELQITEKRPFFQEGADIFEFTLGGGDDNNESLFYSRRVGRG